MSLIQIKRSNTNPQPASLADGELAFSSNGNVLFIGANGGVLPIGGERAPGTLTANQALVANATGYLDVVKTANLYINSFTVNAINATSNSTQLGGNANNELTTTWAIQNFVDLKTASIAGAISNTQVAFSDSGVLAGDADFTFDKTTNVIVVGNNSTGSISVGTGAVNTTVARDQIAVGANVIISPTAVLVGNSTVNSSIAAAAIDTDGSLNVEGISTLHSNVVVNGHLIVANIVSTGNTTITGFINVSSTAEVTGNTLIGGDLSVVGNTEVKGNVALGNNSADKISFIGSANTDLIPDANNTYSLGNSALRWATVNANNIAAEYATFSKDVTVSGNLTVTGDLVTINVSTLAVTDPLLQLAKDNETSDTLDIGFYGHYSDDAGITQRHTGFFRDADDGVFKLFANLVQAGLDTTPGDATVNTAAASFALATLQSYITSGGLISNSSAVTLTANSTLAVNITANTITLATALAATEGGTGHDTYTAGDLLYASNTTYLSQLSVTSNGQILQIVNNLPAYADLDGGTF